MNNLFSTLLQISCFFISALVSAQSPSPGLTAILHTDPLKSKIVTTNFQGGISPLFLTPRNFSLIDGTAPLKLQFGDVGIISLGYSSLQVKPASFKILLGRGSNSSRGDQLMFTNSSLIVNWGLILPTSGGNFSFIPLQIAVNVASINGSFRGQPVALKNYVGTIPSTFLPRFNGAFLDQNGNYTLIITSRSFIPIRGLLAWSGFPVFPGPNVGGRFEVFASLFATGFGNGTIV